MDGELTGNLLVLVAPHRLRKVLYEISPASDVQELDATADRKRGHVSLESRLQESHLARVAACLRRIGLGMRHGSVARRVDIRASGEDDSVERVEGLLGVLLDRRDDDGASARALDRSPTYASGTSAAGMCQTPHRASCAYEVMPMTGLTAPPSPRSRVCRLHTSARGRQQVRGLHGGRGSVSAVELGEGTTVAGNPGVEAPRANLALDLVHRS